MIRIAFGSQFSTRSMAAAYALTLGFQHAEEKTTTTLRLDGPCAPVDIPLDARYILLESCDSKEQAREQTLGQFAMEDIIGVKCVTYNQSRSGPYFIIKEYGYETLRLPLWFPASSTVMRFFAVLKPVKAPCVE